MPFSITMPQLGESVAEGTIGKWLKQPGDLVKRDEPLVEIITDKVTAEMPSPIGGVLKSIAVAEGATVPVGTQIGTLIEANESDQPTSDVSPASAPQADGSSAPPSVETIRPPGEVASVAPDNGRERDQRASPLVRRLALEHAVDISAIHGTGSGGRVTKHDILAYIDDRARGAPTAPAAQPLERAAIPTPALAAAPSAPVPTGDGDELLPLTPMRRSIAEHMVRSVTSAPHAWCLVEVDVTNLVRTRERLLRDWQEREGFELTYLPFFVKAVTESLRENPALNASWSEDGIVLKRHINVGVAVALDDGLIVPVLHDADQKSIAGLAHDLHNVVTRARQHQLTPNDVQGGTFTVNNTGALGSIMSAPIIPQPQAGIVTMESIVKRPVVRDDAIAIRSMMNVCMSFDHRVTDGAQGLRFLQGIRRRLESFGPEMSLY